MNEEQAVHHTTLISGYHVSAASEHHRKNQENLSETPTLLKSSK